MSDEFLQRLFTERPGFLEPEIRRNEILGLIEQGLEDISTTRARLTWGIPWPHPLSTGEVQTTWVWFDALPNYLTGTGYPAAGWETRWPAQLHIVGKDITRLHCVVWPAMLEAAGLPLPERVWAHGFAYFKGEKLSKSAGVTLDLGEAVARHGTDAFRYFLLREIPWDNDGSFTWERFDARYTADLTDGLGNLASRVLAMLARYRGGVVPPAPETELDRQGAAALGRYLDAMDALLLHRGAQAVWEHTRQQVQSFHTALMHEGLAAASSNHHLKLMKHALNLAIDWGMLDKNPVARVPMFHEDNKIEHYMDDVELEHLLTVLHNDENRSVCQIALFLLSTGCRLNEVLSAKWSDVDMSKGIFTIRATNSKRAIAFCNH